MSIYYAIKYPGELDGIVLLDPPPVETKNSKIHDWLYWFGLKMEVMAKLGVLRGLLGLFGSKEFGKLYREEVKEVYINYVLSPKFGKVLRSELALAILFMDELKEMVGKQSFVLEGMGVKLIRAERFGETEMDLVWSELYERDVVFRSLKREMEVEVIGNATHLFYGSKEIEERLFGAILDFVNKNKK